LALISPIINYNWPSLPRSLIRDDYWRKPVLRTRWLANDIDILKTRPKFPMFTKVKKSHVTDSVNIREMSNHI
jgi:hypothetical protein